VGPGWRVVSTWCSGWSLAGRGGWVVVARKRGVEDDLVPRAQLVEVVKRPARGGAVTGNSHVAVLPRQRRPDVMTGAGAQGCRRRVLDHEDIQRDPLLGDPQPRQHVPDRYGHPSPTARAAHRVPEQHPQRPRARAQRG